LPFSLWLFCTLVPVAEVATEHSTPV
jgi:hypothetical protein